MEENRVGRQLGCAGSIQRATDGEGGGDNISCFSTQFPCAQQRGSIESERGREERRAQHNNGEMWSSSDKSRHDMSLACACLGRVTEEGAQGTSDGLNGLRLR